MKAPGRPRIASHCRVAALFAVAALLIALPAVASAAPIRLGVYVAAQGEAGAPEDAGVLDSYAEMVGRKPDIVMDYSNVTDPLLTETEVANLQARGETPMVTWQLFKSGWGGPTIPLAEIAEGKYDDYLRSAAAEAKGMPFSEILIRFGHEMNGDWYGWSGEPSAYVAAWRHVVTIFREEGATNVKWVWSPNVDNGSYPFAAYFPGDSWVDYVGLDGYNWGTAGIGADSWQSLSQVFASSYQQLTQLSTKPVMITETSAGETGGDKAAWIREGFLHTIPQQFPRVEAVIWFDRSQEEDWRINSSQASLDAYREVVASSLYGGAAPPPSREPATEVTELEVTPATTSPGTNRGKGKAKGSHGKTHRRASVHGRVSYRLSRRAPVRLELRGPRIRRRSGFAITIEHPKLHGRVRLSRLTAGRSLPRGRYRIAAAAIDAGGGVSSLRRARFRVVPRHSRSARGQRS